MADKDEDFETTDSNARYIGYAGRIARALNSSSRYLAYTSDVGEAFRPVVSKGLVNAAYGISFAYVGFDVGYEMYKSRKRGDTLTETSRVFLQRSIFQGLASLALPAFTIHTAVDFTAKHIKKVTKSPMLLRYGPTGVGLAVVPLLPVMFDEPVEIGMEKLFDYVWPLSEEGFKRAHHHHKK
ncbi:hypothetical protein HK103_004479 [Boothiomyces macroporosus]|uniref:Mitochondrial fission process protein 1 n=1 Tax=Boothiomyces macroporosus TaxID=261099 RepID=A0AAD5UJE7_9FUNG|nr:hypothetical protein HK103_004479 [Boothiomyces macroporosus]